MVRPEALDLRPVLSGCPSCKRLVSLKGFVLGVEGHKLGETGVVVSEGDVVLAAIQAGDLRGPPDIGVHLVAESGRQRSR